MIGYIRVSDSQRAYGESQREAIKAYAAKHGISDWIEEHVSATKTELSERKLSSLISSQQSMIVSDITRLRRHVARALEAKCITFTFLAQTTKLSLNVR
jgi:DNA invertase Pin-like site-specific DNA recombinase